MSTLLSGLCSAIVGALTTGGRGHYLGMLGGALLLTARQMLLAGATLPYATPTILFGLVVLAAAMALHERQS
jgi:ribose transport system permease protein